MARRYLEKSFAGLARENVHDRPPDLLGGHLHDVPAQVITSNIHEGVPQKVFDLRSFNASAIRVGGTQDVLVSERMHQGLKRGSRVASGI